MKTQETQLLQVRKHLKAKKSITSWQAIGEYHITRLSHYIYILRKEGLNIESKREKLKGKWWVKYILKK